MAEPHIPQPYASAVMTRVALCIGVVASVGYLVAVWILHDDRLGNFLIVPASAFLWYWWGRDAERDRINRLRTAEWWAEHSQRFGRTSSSLEPSDG